MQQQIWSSNTRKKKIGQHAGRITTIGRINKNKKEENEMRRKKKRKKKKRKEDDKQTKKNKEIVT